MARRIDLERAFNQAYQEDAWRNVEQLLQNLSPNLLYHGVAHTLNYVYPEALNIGRFEPEIDDDGLLILAVSALYHDTGFLSQYPANEPIGAKLGRDYAANSNSNALKNAADIIYDAILNTNMQSAPKNIYEKILRDADLSVMGMPEFLEWNQNLRQEILDHPESGMYAFAQNDHDWATSQLKFLESHQWFTAAAGALYQEQKEENIRLFKEAYAEFLT